MVYRKALIVAGLAFSAAPAAAADLSSLYGEALSRNPNVAMERKAVRKASFQQDRAVSGFLPTLEGSAQSTWTKDQRKRLPEDVFGTPEDQDLAYQEQRYSITLTQPLYKGGRNWTSLAIADQVQDQAQAGLNRIKQKLAVRMAKAYFAVLDAQARAQLAQEEVARIRQHLERARARYQQGAGDKVAVRIAEARRDQARTRLLEARNQEGIATQQLRRIIRKEVPELASVANVELREPKPATQSQWVERALNNHPGLREQEASLQEARLQVEKMQGQRWPELQAQARYTRIEESQFYQYSYRRSIGLQLSWTFWQGGRIGAESQMRQMDAARERLKADREQQRIRFETVEKFKNLNNAIDRVRSLRAQVDSNLARLKSFRKGFEVGKRHSGEVLDAQQKFFKAQRKLAQARHEYLLNRLELHAAAGVLTAETIQKTNAQLDPHQDPTLSSSAHSASRSKAASPKSKPSPKISAGIEGEATERHQL